MKKVFIFVLITISFIILLRQQQIQYYNMGRKSFESEVIKWTIDYCQVNWPTHDYKSGKLYRERDEEGKTTRMEVECR